MYYRRPNIWSQSRPATPDEVRVMYDNTLSMIPFLDAKIANCTNPRKLEALQRDLRRWENLASFIFPLITSNQFTVPA